MISRLFPDCGLTARTNATGNLTIIEAAIIHIDSSSKRLKLKRFTEESEFDELPTVYNILISYRSQSQLRYIRKIIFALTLTK